MNFSDRSRYDFTVLLGIQISGPEDDCVAQRRDEYDLVYLRDFQKSCLGEFRINRKFIFISLGVNLFQVFLKKGRKKGLPKHLFQNFIRIENEHIGRTKDRFRSQTRMMTKLPELIENTAAFRQKL